MAEKRMISKVISISEKVNMLPDIFDMLLFTWMIPHTDDFGRLAGSAAKVKALVVPMLDKSLKNVGESLQRLHEEGLILWYEAEGEKVIQIVNFEKHQQGLHKRTRSKFPEYTGSGQDFPGNSGNFPKIPPEEKRREENRTEEKGREEEEKGTESEPSLSPDSNSNPHKDSILNLIKECNVKDVDFYSLDQIYSFIGVVDIQVIEAAVKKSSGKHINYALSTLKNWAAEGKTTMEQVSPPPKVAPFIKPGRSYKSEIPIVQPEQETQLSEEEFAEYIKMAEQMAAASKEGSHGNKEPA